MAFCRNCKNCRNNVLNVPHLWNSKSCEFLWKDTTCITLAAFHDTCNLQPYLNVTLLNCSFRFYTIRKGWVCTSKSHASEGCGWIPYFIVLSASSSHDVCNCVKYWPCLQDVLCHYTSRYGSLRLALLPQRKVGGPIFMVTSDLVSKGCFW